MNTKICIRCGQEKSISEFYKKYKNSEIFDSYCKPCSKINSKEYANKNREVLKEKRKIINQRYVNSHRQKLLQYKRSWHNNHPEEKISRRKSSDLWMKIHPEKNAEYHKNRRARKKNSGGKVTFLEWKSLLDFYGHRCLCCGRTDVKLTQDHVVPLKLGGIHSIDNIQPLCGSCNSKKHTNIIDYRIQL